MMSGDGSLSSTFLDLAGAGADNVTLIAPTNLGGEFIQKYNKEVANASSVPIYAGEGYDIVTMFGEGISRAREDGAEDPEDIRAGIKEYLDTLVGGGSFDGVAKTYSWDEKHELTADDPAALFYIYEVNGGEVKPLGNAAEAIAK
jgi:ABC-type branched-subunit amino acid transport system substrate-binding protein